MLFDDNPWSRIMRGKYIKSMGVESWIESDTRKIRDLRSFRGALLRSNYCLVGA